MESFKATVVRDTISGELDVASAESARQAFVFAGDPPGAPVEVDMTALTFICSAGISTLLRANQDVTSSGGTFTLTNPTGTVAKVLDTLQLDSIVAIRRSV